MALQVSTLTVRRQFLSIAQGRKASGRFVLLQGRPSEEAGAGARFGLTASKRVGNAVARNRARRRLRHALVGLMPVHARPGWDYVAVARTATVDAPWDGLVAELESLFARLHAPPAHRGKDALKAAPLVPAEAAHHVAGTGADASAIPESPEDP